PIPLRTPLVPQSRVSRGETPALTLDPERSSRYSRSGQDWGRTSHLARVSTAVRLYAAHVLRLVLLTVCAVLLCSACGGMRLAGADGVEAGPAPQISLRDQDGRLVDLAQQQGRIVLLTFLYTECRDICPLMASSLNAVLANLDAVKRKQVRVVAVSVDPRGDTFASARRYVREKNLLPEFHYLVGTRQGLQPVGGSDRHLPGPVSPGSIRHPGRIVLIDRN